MGRNPIYRRDTKDQIIVVEINYNGILTAYDYHSKGRLNYICDEISEEWNEMQNLIDEKRARGFIIDVFHFHNKGNEAAPFG